MNTRRDEWPLPDDEQLRELKTGLCRHCGQPVKPPGVKKLPNEYDHAQGCPYSRKKAEP